MSKTSQYQTEPKLAFGTYEDARAMIGHHGKVAFAESEINWPAIKLFCSATEDSNPSYWDPDFAKEQWSGIIAPPGMMMTFMLQLLWRPEGARATPFLAFDVPLPGDTLINVSTEAEFVKPFKVGDHINAYDTLADVSAEKETRMGVGHFVTTVTTYRNQTGEVVARNTNVMFRFTAKRES
ncbi:MAG: acyl dehydratase [Desulfatitalea sp.]|nr:MaoC family dehydratase N-terminal domain-containing protein [Desulfatitalea sp.]NNJ99824.1 acyl dehydratase [Desulfatitalea sp.]